MLKIALAAILLTLAGASFAAPAAQEADHAIHEELRGVLTGVQDAINAKKYDDLAPYFSEKMRVTAITQEVLSNRDEIAPYFKKWFGQGGYLKDLHFTLTADAPTEFYGDKRFGIVRGSGDEKYTLSDGRFFDMATRWTATVVKDPDGKWRILALHIGANFLDNPVLSKAKSSLIDAGIGGLIAGLIVGGLGVFAVMRPKRTSA